MRWCPIPVLVSLLTGPLAADWWHSYLLGVPGVWRCWTDLQSVVVTLSQGPGDYQASSRAQHGDINTVSDLTPLSHSLLSLPSITE